MSYSDMHCIKCGKKPKELYYCQLMARHTASTAEDMACEYHQVKGENFICTDCTDEPPWKIVVWLNNWKAEFAAAKPTVVRPTSS